MAELLVARGDVEAAIGRFEDLLSQKQSGCGYQLMPSLLTTVLAHYDALSRLIDCKRRIGKLEEAETFISAVSTCNIS